MVQSNDAEPDITLQRSSRIHAQIRLSFLLSYIEYTEVRGDFRISVNLQRVSEAFIKALMSTLLNLLEQLEQVAEDTQKNGRLTSMSLTCFRLL